MSVGKTKNQQLTQDQQNAQLAAQIKSENVRIQFEIGSYDRQINKKQADIACLQHDIEILQYNKAQKQTQKLHFEAQLKNLESKPTIHKV